MTMSTLRALLALAAMAGSTGTADADPCGDAGTQTAMNLCFDKIDRAADASLDVSYQEVSGRLGTDSQARRMLVAAETTWLAYRDSECEFEASASAGGSVHPMVVSQCRTALTSSRTHALHRMLDCKEGDLACPLPPK